jgi:SNF2 family DNA or RNA helicase
MVKWVDKPGAEEVVSGLLAGITVRNVFEECHDIPANTMNTVPFYMSAKQAKVYQQMEKNTIALVNGNEIISAANAAVVADKLLQIASGAVYGEDGDSFAHIDTDRYELTAELVIERARPSIVFFNWKHQKVGLIKEFQGRGITYTVIDGTTTDTKREENVCLFQNGFYKVLLAHPASAAHGLTLTRATTTIWVSPTYNLEHFLQGNKRIYRAGQTEKTETIVILADGTIENHVFNVLNVKNAKQVNLLNLLKRL